MARPISLATVSAHSSERTGNPFATPAASRASTAEKPEYFEHYSTRQTRTSSSTLLEVSTADKHAGPYEPRRRKFQSARYQPGEYDVKPWPTGKDDPNYKRKRLEKIIFWTSIGIGLLISCAVCAYEWINVSTGDFCLIWEDDFTKLDMDSWGYEIQRGGFGTGSFDWTTDDPKNAYVDAGGLHIVPTLTTETTNITSAELFNGYVLNLTTAGTCTSNDVTMCSIRSNHTAGTIVNPVRSARLSTKGKHSIKYGRVEVTAKMPQGDWLWPAIWMMPESSVYGKWPQSGEIDIAESKGNAPQTYKDGSNSVSSTLHWGPSPAYDAFWRTFGKHNLQRSTYADGYHTYGLEWTEDYLFTYIDSRLLQVFFIKFSTGAANMWERGKFGSIITPNKTALFDPWTVDTHRNTPFDQEFYLILDVAVGGTGGYFPDTVGNKPWGDASDTAPLEFWKARNQWLPTWGKGNTKGLGVQKVKMWRQGKC